MTEDEQFTEPEFWTILKTPYCTSRPRMVHSMMCDSSSSEYIFHIPLHSGTASIITTVSMNGAQISSNVYDVVHSNYSSRVRFMSPPQSGTVISIYIHE